MTQWEMNVIRKSKRKARLKSLLSSTDYKVIKCYEAQLRGSQMPYDVQALLAERDSWRAELEEIMAFLSTPIPQEHISGPAAPLATDEPQGQGEVE